MIDITSLQNLLEDRLRKLEALSIALPAEIHAINQHRTTSQNYLYLLKRPDWVDQDKVNNIAIYVHGRLETFISNIARRAFK